MATAFVIRVYNPSPVLQPYFFHLTFQPEIWVKQKVIIRVQYKGAKKILVSFTKAFSRVKPLFLAQKCLRGNHFEESYHLSRCDPAKITALWLTSCNTIYGGSTELPSDFEDLAPHFVGNYIIPGDLDPSPNVTQVRSFHLEFPRNVRHHHSHLTSVFFFWGKHNDPLNM